MYSLAGGNIEVLQTSLLITGFSRYAVELKSEADSFGESIDLFHHHMKLILSVFGNQLLKKTKVLFFKILCLRG